MWGIAIGALLFICGVLFLVREATRQRRLSHPHKLDHGSPTLEPRRQGLRFLGVNRNWPGLGLIALGAVLLLSGTFAS
jgi:hypothetical protein